LENDAAQGASATSVIKSSSKNQSLDRLNAALIASIKNFDSPKPPIAGDARVQAQRIVPALIPGAAIFIGRTHEAASALWVRKNNSAAEQ